MVEVCLALKSHLQGPAGLCCSQVKSISANTESSSLYTVYIYIYLYILHFWPVLNLTPLTATDASLLLLLVMLLRSPRVLFPANYHQILSSSCSDVHPCVRASASFYLFVLLLSALSPSEGLLCCFCYLSLPVGRFSGALGVNTVLQKLV